MIKCKFENSDKASLRHVTVDAITTNIEQDKILLHKRTGKILEGEKWALPGGFLERDEKADEAVLRELKEETGYDGEIVKLFRINTRPDRKGEDRQNVTFVFLINACGEGGKSDWEVDEIKWFALDEIPGENEVAFDHYENIKLYKEYLEKKLNLPVID